jgi:hypothetical protein
VKLIIGDRGFKRTGTLDIRKEETLKPEIKIRERARSYAKSRVDENRTCGSGTHQRFQKGIK